MLATLNDGSGFSMFSRMKSEGIVLSNDDEANGPMSFFHDGQDMGNVV